MTTTWILVAHRSGATIYAHTTPGSLTRVREVPHPEGRLQSREIGEDRPGRSYEGHGTHRSAMDPEVELTREVEHAFARSLASALASARNDHAYERLILMAEPRMLGELRAALDAHTAAAVVGSVAKDLPRASDTEVRAHLRDLVNV